MKSTTRRSRPKSGFTLIELLVTIAVIGILVGLLVPAVQSIRESVRRTDCSNRIRQIALGLTSFESANGHFPAGISGPASSPYPSMSWLARILPYAEQQAVWDQAVADYQNNASPYHGGHLGLRTPIGLFQCPSDPDVSGEHWTPDNQLVALTSYLGVNGTSYHNKDGVFYTDSSTKTSAISDGLSQTLLIGERPPSFDYSYGHWYAIHNHSRQGSPNMLLGVAEVNDPQPPGIVTYLESCPPGPYSFGPGDKDDPCAALHFWSTHKQGAHFALADGSVRFIGYSIAPNIMVALATRSGGEAAVSVD